MHFWHLYKSKRNQRSRLPFLQFWSNTMKRAFLFWKFQHYFKDRKWVVKFWVLALILSENSNFWQSCKMSSSPTLQLDCSNQNQSDWIRWSCLPQDFQHWCWQYTLSQMKRHMQMPRVKNREDRQVPYNVGTKDPFNVQIFLRKNSPDPVLWEIPPKSD